MTTNDGKDSKDPKSGDGTGSESGSGTDGGGNSGTSVAFGELTGYIDERIQSAVRAVLGKGSGTGSGSPPKKDNVSDVAQQVRDQLALLDAENSAKQKDADRDVTIAELKAKVDKIPETGPVQEVSKLTKFMWGGGKKS